MTREEAIGYLLGEYVVVHEGNEYEKELNEVLDVAIEALKGGDAEMNEVKSPYMQQTPNGATHGRLIDADALKEYFFRPYSNEESYSNIDIAKIIDNAPTVSVVDITQRDLCEDISCTDCPFMQETCKLMDYVAYADRPHGEWRTGKPTENGEYMVTLDAWGHRYIDVMHYAKPQMPNREVDGTCWYRDDDEWGDVVYDDSDIVAWMPLPDPYKGE